MHLLASGIELDEPRASKKATRIKSVCRCEIPIYPYLYTADIEHVNDGKTSDQLIFINLDEIV